MGEIFKMLAERKDPTPVTTDTKALSGNFDLSNSVVVDYIQKQLKEQREVDPNLFNDPEKYIEFLMERAWFSWFKNHPQKDGIALLSNKS